MNNLFNCNYSCTFFFFILEFRNVNQEFFVSLYFKFEEFKKETNEILRYKKKHQAFPPDNCMICNNTCSFFVYLTKLFLSFHFNSLTPKKQHKNLKTLRTFAIYNQNKKKKKQQQYMFYVFNTQTKDLSHTFLFFLYFVK